MKGMVMGGLLLSVVLAAGSFLVTSDAPDGLEAALERYAPEEFQPSAPPLRRALRGAAGVVLVFSFLVGFGTWRKGRTKSKGQA